MTATEPLDAVQPQPWPQPGEESWLWSIVAGLALAAVPWPDPPEGLDGIAVSRLLDTEAYRAWLVGWAPRSCRAVDASLHVHSFCVVQGGLELLGEPWASEVPRTYGSGHGGVVTTPSGRFRSGDEPTTSIHVVLFGPEATAPDLPWSLCAATAR